jgi:hypothetical protein
MKKLSLAEARRIAIHAQGLGVPRPAKPNRTHVKKVFERLGLIQIDFVNVLVPAHYFVPFSRLGPYDRKHLDHLAYRSGDCTEQWAHEASIVAMDHWPLLQYRRDAYRARPLQYERHLKRESAYMDSLIEQIRQRGPLTAADFPGPKGSDGRMPGDWYRSFQRIALETHFGNGTLAVANRLPNFTRAYDLAHRVIPAKHQKPVEAAEARTRLLAKAANAFGVATLADLADYYRMRRAEARAALKTLLDNRTLEPVEVEGWRDPAYLAPGACTQPVDARALLSPFDPLVWFRPRIERLFAFEYRIEIYTPASKRRWGYYVLPFLLGDQLAARVDLKADRENGRLVALSTHYETHASKKTVDAALRIELAEVASWLGLEPR